jgi:predicted nucleic acid-binding protein
VLLELDAGRLLRSDTINPRTFSWLTPVVITTELNALPPNRLGAGERAVIAYAITKPNATVALDDRQARLLAAQFNLKIIGIIGILIKAKQANLIPIIQPLLNALPQHGFRLSPTIYQEALKLANESPS